MATFCLSKLFESKHLRRTSERRRWHTRSQLVSFTFFMAIGTLFYLLSSSTIGLLHASEYVPAKSGGEIAISYLYQAADRIIQRGISAAPLVDCDIFTGKWVYDSAYPMYNASSCPFAEIGFRCQEHGRPDSGYLRWRWQPLMCNIPRFNAQDMRRRLKGLRVAFIGDSIGRTQWESFVCLLMADISDKGSVYEVKGNPVTKTRPYLAVRFSSYNFTIEYYRSPFLVQQGSPPKHAPKRVQLTLKLDKIDPSKAKWQHADVLVFNTGHWWIPTHTYGRGRYFQVGDSLKLGMKIETAYGIALGTWASWVESNIDFNKTRIFFRSFEPSHWEGTWRNQTCPLETKPILNLTYNENFPHFPVLQHVIGSMKVPVSLFNVTTLSSYRRDSHVANWTDEPNRADCLHWCLPGVPDIWNELLYVSLLQKEKGVWIQQKE